MSQRRGPALPSPQLRGLGQHPSSEVQLSSTSQLPVGSSLEVQLSLMSQLRGLAVPSIPSLGSSYRCPAWESGCLQCLIPGVQLSPASPAQGSHSPQCPSPGIRLSMNSSSGVCLSPTSQLRAWLGQHWLTTGAWWLGQCVCPGADGHFHVPHRARTGLALLLSPFLLSPVSSARCPSCQGGLVTACSARVAKRHRCHQPALACSSATLVSLCTASVQWLWRLHQLGVPRAHKSCPRVPTDLLTLVSLQSLTLIDPVVPVTLQAPSPWYP